MYDDMERFACGYCGTELIVQRRGGTVALRAVTEAIRKVQIGTDKTAAELALARLNQEAGTIDAELKKLGAEAGVLKGKSNMNVGCGVSIAAILLLIGLMMFVGGLASNVSAGTATLGFIMAVAGIAWIVTAVRSPELPQVTLLETQMRAKKAELATIKGKMVEQRRIVDLKS